MTEFIFTPEDQRVAARHPRFPVLAQFLLLVTVLGGLLGGVVLPYLVPPATADRQTPHQTPVAAAIVATPLDITIPSSVQAEAVYIYDVELDRMIAERNADQTLPLASLTKLMTTLVTHELLADESRIVVPKSATEQTSASGLAWGEVFTATALQEYALLASSNDAAFSLAEAGGTLLATDADAQTAFVTAMNITAEELNLSSLTFKNPTGLDLSPTEAGAYGTARDISFLLKYILATYPDLLHITTTAAAPIYNTDGLHHDAENTNPDIAAIPNLIASKTGYTELAQGNLTIAFDAGYNRPIIITVLGSGYQTRFSDVTTLVAAVQRALAQPHE